MSSRRNNRAPDYLLPANFPGHGEWNGGPQLRNDAQLHGTTSDQAHPTSYIATNLARTDDIPDIGYTWDAYNGTTHMSPNRPGIHSHQRVHPGVTQYSSGLTISQAELSLPSYQETEKWLRNHLKIPAPRPLNLWCLQELTTLRKLPNLTEMIFLAIWGSPFKRLGLSEIYAAIEHRYPALITYSNKAWQRSIRHRLSLKACFVRVLRDRRGADWMLDVSKGLKNKRSYKTSPSQSATGTSADQSTHSAEDSASPFMGYSSDSETFLTPSPEVGSAIGDYTFMSSGQSIFDVSEERMDSNLDNNMY